MRIECRGLKYREFGYNQGLPMVHFDVSSGKGDKFTILAETIANHSIEVAKGTLSKGTKWVCIETPEDGEIPTGLGGYITGLKDHNFKVDLHIHNPLFPKSSTGAPGWINKPSTVIVDYNDEGNLNYYSLGKNDIVYFHDNNPNGFDQTEVTSAWEDMKYVPCTRWLLLKDAYSPEHKQIMSEFANELVYNNQGSRLSWVS